MRPGPILAGVLDAQRGHLFSWVPVCFATGIGLYFALPAEPGPAAWAVLAAAALAGLALPATRHLRAPLLIGLLAVAAPQLVLSGLVVVLGSAIALVGALGFALVGRGVDGLAHGSSGFVYWPAVAAISVTSVASAPLGARLAHRLDQAALKRLFALFIGLLGIGIMVRNLPAL